MNRYILRAAAALLGVILGASASTLFFLYWFSAKEEIQGLREVFQRSVFCKCVSYRDCILSAYVEVSS